MNSICTSFTKWAESPSQFYLKHSKPLAYTVGLLAFGLNAISGFQNQFYIKAAVSVLGAAALAYLAYSAVKDEMRTSERQKNLLKLADEVNAESQDHFPKVAIFHCQSDHNGAFDSSRSRFRYLKGAARVDLIPTSTIQDINSHNIKKGAEHLVLSGHGTPKEVEFREDIFCMKRGSLHISQIRPDSFDFIDPRGTILIDACSTGCPNGLAQRISLLTGRVVQAPHCDLDSEMGWFIMDPEYGLVFLALDENMDSAISHYRKGELLDCPILNLENLQEIAIREKDCTLMTYTAHCYFKRQQMEKAREAVLKSFQLDMPRGIKSKVFHVQQMILDATGYQSSSSA